ncbi:hypothetical protein HYDPIDRAFT_34377 [Hydnomerulius pinastri MD-312]|uniref:Ketoreductase domain-containing protein n=1 Tax=Hydnomerulius pinastri MD-312 TaxID=994086 RepID=A0A0C9W794_9AGAM|nr:hypothetical protein HYDPIDRAFT_34377 [Hydnomerulius pinastri MD-312]
MSVDSAPKGVALVTGSGRGIGRSIALRLASEGYDLGLNDIPKNKGNLDEISAEIASEYPGRRVCVLLADVSVEDEVKAMVEGVVKQLGQLDVMVANAGIARFGTLLQTTTEDWDTVLAVNARGTFLCYKYAAQQMIAQKTKGRIIGASSVAGKQGQAILDAYCASKFAVRGLTQCAAIELGRYGITVNAYAPGPIDTDMLTQLHNATIQHTGDEGGIYAEMERTTALGYLGNPKDIAGLVSYLVSPEAHFITGQTLSINGGLYFD